MYIIPMNRLYRKPQGQSSILLPRAWMIAQDRSIKHARIACARNRRRRQPVSCRKADSKDARSRNSGQKKTSATTRTRSR